MVPRPAAPNGQKLTFSPRCVCVWSECRCERVEPSSRAFCDELSIPPETGSEKLQMERTRGVARSVDLRIVRVNRTI